MVLLIDSISSVVKFTFIIAVQFTLVTLSKAVKFNLVQCCLVYPFCCLVYLCLVLSSFPLSSAVKFSFVQCCKVFLCLVLSTTFVQFCQVYLCLVLSGLPLSGAVKVTFVQCCQVYICLVLSSLSVFSAVKLP